MWREDDAMLWEYLCVEVHEAQTYFALYGLRLRCDYERKYILLYIIIVMGVTEVRGRYTDV